MGEIKKQVESFGQAHEKVAVISGGSKGLGKHLRDMLLERGWYVYTISRTFNDDEIPKPAKHLHITFDFTSGQSIQQVCDAITHPKVDLLINNAGVAYAEEYNATSIEGDFEKVFQTNFVSAITLALALGGKLAGGTVITISSDLSYVPVQGLSLYAASKSALNVWFASYAKSKTDTRFVTVVPSMIDTPMLKELLGNAYSQHKDSMMSPKKLTEKVLSIEDDTSIKTSTEIFIAHPSMAHSPQEILSNKLFWETENNL